MPRGSLRRDLIPARVVPDRPQRELAALVRDRRSLSGERTREGTRIRTVLEGATSTRGSARAKLDGVAGHAILQALVRGVTAPGALAALADPHVQPSQEDRKAALTALLGSHQRVMLVEQLAQSEEVNARIARLDAEIEERTRPFPAQIAALAAMPGIGITSAQEIVASSGVDRSRVPPATHLASGATVAPGTHASAGKRLPGGTGRTTPSRRAVLVEAAPAASRKRGTSLAAQSWRLAPRLGTKKAAIAVAHSIIVIVSPILRDAVAFAELGADFVATHHPEATTRRAVAQLERLGYHVTLEPAA